MINVVQAREAIPNTDAADMVISKEQFSLMLDEIARGNAARIRLTNIRSIANAGASAAGLSE
jgi:hypothetical protein